MPSNSDARKKARERAQLEHFKKSFTEFPIGKIRDSENPDFLIEGEEGCIGIEITELHLEASINGSHPPRAQLARKAEALRQAERLCEERQLGIFHVTVNFHPGREITKVRQVAFAEELAGLIERYLPGAGQRVIVKHLPETPLLNEIVSISLDQVPLDSKDRNYIVQSFSGSYDLYDAKDMQVVLERKEARVAEYKRQCNEVWLLIIGGQVYPSTWVELDSEVGEHLFKSQFDKTFYFHMYRGEVVEIGLRRP